LGISCGARLQNGALEKWVRFDLARSPIRNIDQIPLLHAENLTISYLENVSSGKKKILDYEAVATPAFFRF
jgi:hypothetical protein